jgi:hypothetical protein
MNVLIKNNLIKNLGIIAAAFILMLFVFGCEGEDSDESAVIYEKKLEDLPQTNIVKFNGRMFNLPSPVQASEVVKSTQSPYREELLNPSDNYQNYSTSYKQALNLGVYGADLAYLNIYEKFNIATEYFEVVKKLTQELNIVNSFTEEVLNKIEKNKKNKDSLLYITSKAYRDADSYLIQNERNDISILVLAGGWIESMYILTQTSKNTDNKEVINRIGQQKYALDNLIELMRPYYGTKSDDYDKLLQNLSDLALVFDGVVINYEYKTPETIREEKLTIINSETLIEINEYQLEHIRESIVKIRQTIIR